MRSRVTHEGDKYSKWSHRDMMRLAHLRPAKGTCPTARAYVYNYLVKGTHSAELAAAAAADQTDAGELATCVAYLESVSKLQQLGTAHEQAGECAEAGELE